VVAEARLFTATLAAGGISRVAWIPLLHNGSGCVDFSPCSEGGDLGRSHFGHNKKLTVALGPRRE
jgi:hypothetical protein